MTLRAPLLLALLFLVACRHESESARVTAPSDAEAEKFAGDYRDALVKSNVQRAAMMIDFDAILDRATAHTDVGFGFKQGFLIGARKAGGAGGFAQQLADMLTRGGDLHPLRVRTTPGGEKRAVIRLILPDGGVNYHEMVLGRDKSGVVRANDIYVYTSGEALSESMRRMFLFAAAQDPSLLQRLAGKENNFAKHLDEYKEMMDKVRSGDAKGAEELYQRLPDDAKHEKSVLIAHVSATAKLDNTAYVKALEELKMAFPNEAGFDLMSVDMYLLKEQYDEALKAIDRVDAAVGGDPYLDILRSNLYTKWGKAPEAEEAAKRAVAREPGLAARIQE